MKGTTHLAFGLASSLYLAPEIITYAGSGGINAPCSFTLIMCGTLIGSLIPDIDSPRSKIGRKVPVPSHLIGFFIGHRTLFHSLVIPAFLSILTYILKEMESASLFPVLFLVGSIDLGYILHIILDSLTKEGVPLLYPFSDRYFGLKLVREGGIIDYLLGFILFAFTALKILKYIA